MKTLVVHLWGRIRTSFWFFPAMFVVAATVIACATLAVDHIFEKQIASWLPKFQEVSADGVRAVLSTAATAVLTLTGVTFSATLVALTLASSQFGGRLLRNFIRSVPNQVTLGVLLANFVLCMIVLRSVGGVAGGEFIPHVSALAAFLATLGSLAVFIFFIHHIVVSLQAENVVASVYSELDGAIDEHFPDQRPDGEAEQDASEEKLDWDKIDQEIAVVATRSGYVQAVDREGLVALCSRLDLCCRVLHRPGQFVQHGASLIAIGGEKASDLGEEEREGFLERIYIGRMRTAEEDFQFGLRQLVEVALRALSPGINDPFTAMNCIDYLGAAIAKAAQRSLPERVFADENGTPRVQVRPLVFGDLVATGFDQIRQAAGTRPDIAIRLLDALAGIFSQVKLETHCEIIRSYAELVADTALAATEVGRDQEAIRKAYEQIG